MNDAELRSLVSSAAAALVSRVYSAVPQGDAVLVELCEQWSGALTLAVQYANDERAGHAADALLEELIAALRGCGIHSF